MQENWPKMLTLFFSPQNPPDLQSVASTFYLKTISYFHWYSLISLIRSRKIWRFWTNRFLANESILTSGGAIKLRNYYNAGIRGKCVLGGLWGWRRWWNKTNIRYIEKVRDDSENWCDDNKKKIHLLNKSKGYCMLENKNCKFWKFLVRSICG